MDPAVLVDEVNRHSDLGLRLTGRAEQGEVGAGYVQLADGTTAVLTVSGATPSELACTAAGLDRIAAAVPVPRYLRIVDLGHRRAIIQQRLPGRAPDRVDAALIGQLVDVVDQFRGVGGTLDPVNLYLRSSGPGFCVHETLAAFDGRSRRLLTRIQSVGATAPEREPGDDLVHLDLHPGNVLIEPGRRSDHGLHPGRLSGLVDWDGIGSGDRRFGLVTLSFDVAHGILFDPRYAGLEAGDLEPILSRLAAVPVERVRAWWASMSLRQVDWTIRHGYPTATVDFYLTLANRGLDELQSGPLSIGTLTGPH
jgi:hypothetical protein